MSVDNNQIKFKSKLFSLIVAILQYLVSYFQLPDLPFLNLLEMLFFFNWIRKSLYKSLHPTKIIPLLWQFLNFYYAYFDKCQDLLRYSLNRKTNDRLYQFFLNSLIVLKPSIWETKSSGKNSQKLTYLQTPNFHNKKLERANKNYTAYLSTKETKRSLSKKGSGNKLKKF